MRGHGAAVLNDESLVAEELRLQIRDGALADEHSWLYVWQRPRSSAVVYVGATGLPPAARTWLHLNHEDPSIGRIRAEHPDALSGEVVVRAFRLAAGIDRGEVKAALLRVLAGEEPDAGGDAGRAAATIAARL